MTRTRKASKKEKNDNPFRQNGIRSLVPGLTHSTEKMKNRYNHPRWHKQFHNRTGPQFKHGQLLQIIGRAENAFKESNRHMKNNNNNNNNNNNKPSHATKAQRNSAIYQRLMGELASLEGRHRLSKEDENRKKTLKNAVKEYAPSLNFRGGGHTRRRKQRGGGCACSGGTMPQLPKL